MTVKSAAIHCQPVMLSSPPQNKNQDLITTVSNPTLTIPPPISSPTDIEELADYGIPEGVIELYKKEGITALYPPQEEAVRTG